MADVKISALPASTTPLAGTEVLPIVQSGATKQVSVANLTAGRAISATSVTASTGNFVVGTSGQGVDFSATPGTGTSELLADYEEGTWTPTVFHNGVQITSLGGATGKYIKIGDMVYIAGYASKSSAQDLATGAWEMRNLPFTVGGTNGYPICTFNGAINSAGTAVGVWGTAGAGDTKLNLLNSTMNTTAWGSGYFELYASGCFETL